jgi:group II intron reverse transcriptase/maturase
MKDKVSELRGRLYDMAKAEPERRFHSLYDKIWRMDVLEEAWASVRKNGGSPGMDGITIGELNRAGIEQLLHEIQSELKTKTYSPLPLRRVYIPKPDGKRRGLAIPTVKDRIVQTAVRIVMEPIFEPQFEPNSFGFRPGKSAHNAVDEIVKYLNYGCEHVIDADISACFDNIDRHRLMEQIARRISDGSLLHLIRQFLDTGIMEDSEIIDTQKGTPQGSPLSPLLANIYLDQLDKQWKASGLHNRFSGDAHLIRYADDFVILMSRNPDAAMEKLESIIESIGLTLNAEKTRTTEAEDGFEFLGFRFVRQYSRWRNKRVTRWFPSPKSETRIREKILNLTDNRARALMTPEEAKDMLIPVLRGWGNYFAHSPASNSFREIWNYAQHRLMYMHCHQHNIPRMWRSSEIKELGLSIMETMPSTFPGKRHNTMS